MSERDRNHALGVFGISDKNWLLILNLLREMKTVKKEKRIYQREVLVFKNDFPFSHYFECKYFPLIKIVLDIWCFFLNYMYCVTAYTADRDPTRNISTC